MSINKIKAFLSRAKATLPGRWLWLLIGLGLIVNGQTLMHQREPAGEINDTLELWNITFRLDIVNMQNFGAAIPYLLAGGLLSTFAFLPGWGKRVETQAAAKNKAAPNWAYLLPRLGIAILLYAYLITKLARHDYNPVLPWLWASVLGLLTYLLYRREKSSETALSPNFTRADMYWMIGLFLFGLGTGSFALQDIPSIMVPDEGSFWEAARGIAAGEFKPAFFDFGVYTFPIASSIFQGWALRLFGVNLWGWRFASVLAGTFTVFPLYLLAREWFDRRVAAMAAVFMLASPYYLSFARMGYNNSQALFPVVLGLYFWSLGYRRHSYLYFWLAGLAAGVGFYTYPAAWLGLVAIVSVMVLLSILRRIQFRQALLFTLIFLAATALTAGPRLVYGASGENAEPLFHKLLETSFVNSFYGSAFYGPAELYPNGTAFVFGKNQAFFAPEVYAELLARSLVRTLAALFDPFIVTEHFMTTNFAGGFMAALGLTLGLGFSLRAVKQTHSILLLAWLGAGLFFLSIIAAFPPRHTHLVTVIPALALLSAIGWTVFTDTLVGGLGKRWSPSLAAWVRKGILAVVSAVLVLSGLHEYFIIMPMRNPPPFEDIASWIAWRTREPLTIYYLDSTEKTPHRVEYLINTRMVPHTYDSLPSYDFNWQRLPKGSIVFIEPEENNLPPPPLSFDNAAAYFDRDGDIIGYARSNTDVDLQPAPPFPVSQAGFQVKIIPILSGLAIIVFLVATLQIRVRAEKATDRPGLLIHAEISLRKTFKKEADTES